MDIYERKTAIWTGECQNPCGHPMQIAKKSNKKKVKLKLAKVEDVVWGWDLHGCACARK